jgi:hypothetical protein
VTALVLDQAACCHGDQRLPGPRFRGIERALALDGEDRLLDLVREELATL